MQQNQRQKWDSFYVRTAVALLVVKEKTGAPATLHTCYDLVKGFAPLPIHTPYPHSPATLSEPSSEEGALIPEKWS